MATTDPATRYARDVVEGRVVAGRLVRLAAARHLSDLDTGRDRGLRWDPAAAGRVVEFFRRFLRHSKGEWAGQPLDLAPWQEFRLGSVFGWKRADGLRRFRVAHHEVARRNGKSTEAAGVGLYMLDADGEPGAEVYSGATMRPQARIVWDEAARMVRRHPALRRRIVVLQANMSVEETASRFVPLSADEDTLDGLNVHCAIIDELHAHRTRAVWDALDTGTGSRRSPLLWAITTAGYNQAGVCYENRAYCVDVLEGRVSDDSWFAYIATLDDPDAWQDEAAWPMANPNLGASVKLADLRQMAAKARASPAAVNSFLTKRLNIWTQQHTRWLSLDTWDENGGGPVNPVSLAGRRCYGGLDLSSVSDLTAFVLLFPRDDPETCDVLARFWCPAAQLANPANRYRDQYAAWAREGHLTVTPGDAVDYAFVREAILRDAATYHVVDMNIDRLFQAHQLAAELADEGLTVVGMGQGFLSMAAPVRELERRLLLRKVRHGGNPVLRWMAGNVTMRLDPAGNAKPDKATSQGKIDGIVALVMALDRAMRHAGPARRSIYEDPGTSLWL